MMNIENFHSVKTHEMVKCTCDYCGKDFLRKKGNLYGPIKKENPVVFCGTSCARKFLNPCVYTNCAQCNKEISIIPSRNRANKNGLNFCSKRCKGDFMRIKEQDYINLQCEFCQKDFSIRPCIYNGKIRSECKHIFCSTKCRTDHHKTFPDLWKKRVSDNPLTPLCCPNCKETFTPTRQPQKLKHGLRFCSRPCIAKYFSIYGERTRSSHRISFPEIYLRELIKTNFPHLEILENNRKFLDCGLEIDILFPKINLAIEINGPTHYMPIFGEKCFEEVRLRDSIKWKELHDKNISFLILNVSNLNTKKRQIKFLEKEFNEKIKPLIQSKL